MSDRIVSITFPKCGTCCYAKNFKQGMADCFGHPPSVHVVGASNDALGRPVLNLETFVPRIKEDRPGCALYKRKEDFETSGTG